ncbi:MAG: ImuA family protein [Acetobacteraceae bacterium]
MLAALRALLAPPAADVLPLGLSELDRALPGGGLARGALHEIASTGIGAEHAAAATLFLAGILTRTQGPVLWVLERADLFAPALAEAGLSPDRVIQAEAGGTAAVLAALEDGLRHPGLAAGVGEVSGRVSLTASRRLQLAAAGTGTLAFLLRRPWRAAASADAPSAAVTRWRVGAEPAAPPFADAPEVPGLGRARWRLALWRARGAPPADWVVDAWADGTLGLPLTAPAAAARRAVG